MLYLEVNLYLCSIKTLHGGPSLARYPVLFILENLQNAFLQNLNICNTFWEILKDGCRERDPSQRASLVLIWSTKERGEGEAVIPGSRS